MNEEPIWPETPRSIVLERLKEYSPRLSRTCRKESNYAFDWPDSHLLGRVSHVLLSWLDMSEKERTGTGQSGKILR